MMPYIVGDVQLAETGFTARLADGRLLVVDAGARFSPTILELEPLQSDKDGLEPVGDGLTLSLRRGRFSKGLADSVAQSGRDWSGPRVEGAAQRSVFGDAMRRICRIFDAHDSPSVDAHGPESRVASESIVGGASGATDAPSVGASDASFGASS